MCPCHMMSSSATQAIHHGFWYAMCNLPVHFFFVSQTRDPPGGPQFFHLPYAANSCICKATLAATTFVRAWLHLPQV